MKAAFVDIEDIVETRSRQLKVTQNPTVFFLKLIVKYLSGLKTKDTILLK